MDALCGSDWGADRYTWGVGWLKGFDREALILRRVFPPSPRKASAVGVSNEDGSTGVLNLVCSDLTINSVQAATNYQKRWQVEKVHKSQKSDAELAESSYQTVKTQSNRVFMSIYAVFKLECLKIKYKTSHFAFRAKFLIIASP